MILTHSLISVSTLGYILGVEAGLCDLESSSYIWILHKQANIKQHFKGGWKRSYLCLPLVFDWPSKLWIMNIIIEHNRGGTYVLSLGSWKVTLQSKCSRMMMHIPTIKAFTFSLLQLGKRRKGQEEGVEREKGSFYFWKRKASVNVLQQSWSLWLYECHSPILIVLQLRFRWWSYTRPFTTENYTQER